MSGGDAPGARELDQTPTWAVAVVCAVIVLISIILEKLLHHIGELFQERKKMALVEALEKVKGELMVLGFISLLLTFGQSYISQICIPVKLADTMLYCPKRVAHQEITPLHGPPSIGDHEPPSIGDHEPPSIGGHEPPSIGDHEPPPIGDHEPPSQEHKGAAGHHRRLLWYERRFLGGGDGGEAAGCKAGYVPLISVNGLHQLHIFIFFLAVFHVIYSAITMTLGRLKTRGWKEWEQDALKEQEGASRFRLTHEDSFVKDHTSAWAQTKVSFYLLCFFRQFFRSVRRADYMTMRHGFISVHLAPGSKFDFQKYIKRSLEDDFKVVVGISPLLWASAVLFLLLDVHGWHATFIFSMIPLVVTLAVGAKLQKVIAQMAIEIKEKHAVIQGMPLVQVDDRHFWFGWPQLVLYLIHFVLFQNAFEITYFFWIWHEFGLRSCFHQEFNLAVARVFLGVIVQFMCSYITLPLYALVTQMGSTMKRSIFDEQTSKALKQWHMKAVKKKSDGRPEHGRTKTLGGSPPDSPDGSSHAPSGAHKEGTDVDGTANIMASVDLNGDGGGQRDLLTSP